MEFATSKFLVSSFDPLRIPLNSPKISTFTWRRTKNYPSRLPISSTSRKFSLPLTRFQISARFGRPTKRQNHVRKKHTLQQQLEQVCNLPSPLLEFDRVDVDNPNVKAENFEQKATLDDEIINLATNGVKELEIQLPQKPFGKSINWNKLESWAQQYKKDSDFWGVGTGTIFNITQDSEGKAGKVTVNEDEILRRCRSASELDSEIDEFEEAMSKISFAHGLARDMEIGSNVIPKNSTVAKFSSSFAEHAELKDTIQSVRLKTGLFSRMSKLGFLLLCGLLVVRVFFTAGGSKTGATTEKEQSVKGNVEVVDDPIGSKILSSNRPRLNKEKLINSINQLKGPTKGLGIVEYSGYDNEHLENKISEIKQMARSAREIEKRNSFRDGELEDEVSLSPESDLEVIRGNSSGTTELISVSVPDEDIGQFSEALMGKNMAQIPDTSNGSASSVAKVGNISSVCNSADFNEPNLIPTTHKNNSQGKKFRIMKSVEEAREYLSKNHQRQMVDGVCEAPDGLTDIPMNTSIENVAFAESCDMLDVTEKVNNICSTSGSPDSLYSTTNPFMVNKSSEKCVGASNNLEKLFGASDDEVHARDEQNGIFMIEKHDQKEDQKSDKKTSEEENERMTSSQLPGGTTEQMCSLSKENWISKNYHEFEPIVERIRAGFQDNYNVARQKANNDLVPKVDQMQLKSDGGESEFEWMKDEKLMEIVFKVRDNELLGRDPFHGMKEDDKRLFFCGLEKRVEQENEKLRSLHEYFHSNIENLDYGAEGVSLYDPPEKVIPRWKVPPADKNPEFLNNFLEERKTLVAEGLKTSISTKKTGNIFVDKSEEPSSCERTDLVEDISVKSAKVQGDPSLSSKTVIQGSDGSVKAGKKSGKEFWQHTKKWSEGFLESYNAETDPEVKSVMKDIGKGLDRWITEKEIQEAAELMDKLPEKGQKFVKEKLDKVKREMELFGPQAVVSKYKEYAEEKIEDYLWWLDLPCVMCIELYTVENGEQRVGFYSLEMAVDLELDPKQYHVIAFEDASDCKNLCYIIQAHLELLGNGNAFVVARPPKDAFREAKENGFSVTVIKNRQLQLNIDQTLEEVEELIQEIGSKIYHDKLMKERSMDINALMKGVFGTSKRTKRKKRSKRKPNKDINQ